MGSISASIVLLAGAILIAAASMASGMTDNARQRLAGFGFLVFVIGAIGWMLLLITEMAVKK